MRSRVSKLGTAAIAAGVTTLLLSISPWTSNAASPSPRLELAAGSSTSTGSSAVTDLGATGGWKVLTSATATQTGATISTPGFSTSGWLTVANDDGGAPGHRDRRAAAERHLPERLLLRPT